MNSKNTWVWLLVVIVLVGLAVASQKFSRNTVVGPERVLSDFKAAITIGVQVTPAGQLDIRAERTNAAWVLSKPISYPAQGAGIDRLLSALEALNVAGRISGADLRKRPDAEAEFGLQSPQFTLAVQNRDAFRQLKVGALTPSGDQVYLQVVGVDGLFVVDAQWLKLLPRKVDDWRDLALVDLRTLAFDRIAVSNTASFELQRAATNQPWIAARPVSGARVDNERLLLALQKLHTTRVAQFVSDDPGADMAAFGLQPPELQVSFSQGTNRLVRLEFGRVAGTNASQIYARRADRGGVVAVPKAMVESWYEPFEKFRDHRLLGFSRSLDQVEVRGDESFILQWQSGVGWKIPGTNFPVDFGAVNEFLQGVADLSIMQFKDTVTELDLKNWGLADGARQVIFRSTVTNAGIVTNLVVTDLTFGTTNGDAIHVRRADESAVYSVALAAVQRFPTEAWQLRQRRIWNFSPHEVERVTIRQGDEMRVVVHAGTNVWTPAEKLRVGELVDNLRMEEVAYRFGELTASVWVEPNAKNLARYGITTNGHSVVISLVNGEKREIQFGGASPSNYPYAAVNVDGQTWVMEFPLEFYHNVYASALRKLGLRAMGP